MAYEPRPARTEVVNESLGTSIVSEVFFPVMLISNLSDDDKLSPSNGISFRDAVT